MSEYPDPTRLVADADVLAADLLVDGTARDAIDVVREHEWMTLVITDELLDGAGELIADVAGPGLAADWKRRARADFLLVSPTVDGHPALVAAEEGNAATVLSLDERLQSVAAGTAIRRSVSTSVKSPAAFTSIVDPEALVDASESSDDSD